MRALDPRLLRRTRAARPLLAADVVLGLLTVACVIAQATALARVVAGAFAGDAVAHLRGALVALAAAFSLRGLLAWGMDATGRRAAASVLSELRLALLERRLSGVPDAGSAMPSGEIAATAVQGVDALEA